MMVRISVTTLEKFRRYLREESSFDSEESLIESIKGLFAGNDKTKFGHAYHSIIEGNFTIEGDLIVAGDFKFNKAQAAPALKYRDEHPLMIHEMNVSKVFHTGFGPIQVVGRIDGIEGMIVNDSKTKFRAPSVEEYLDSSQWRYYLDMLELNEFYFNLFEVKGFDQLPQYPPFQFSDIEIVAHEPIHCLRYQHMHEELTSHLNLFLEYIHNRNLTNYLKPAIEEQLFA